MSKSDRLLSKIVSCDDFLVHLSSIREKGLSVVFTNGCFDILHRGHVQYLCQAASYGDVLVVGLNSDSSVRELKGAGRPLQDQESRLTILASLFFVDFVILFHEDTPLELISKIFPDILIKGGDYKIEEIAGHEVVERNGGKVITIPFLKGYSTTSIIEKLRKI
jgi:rfaE bifunctional protein nucleotidyltransferase chain/domain